MIMTSLLTMYVYGIVGMFVTGLVGYLRTKRAGEDTFGHKAVMILSPIWPMATSYLVVDAIVKYLAKRELDKKE